MITTCCAIIGLVFLVLTNLAAIISFATPYWFQSGIYNRGLWAYCNDQTCTWVFQDHALYVPAGQDSAWWLATQVLMSFGLALSLFALLVATMALCCECKNCNSSHGVAAILLLGFLVIGTAVVVFGISANNALNVEIKDSIHRFCWSFWLATATSGMSLITAIVYACEGRSSYV